MPWDFLAIVSENAMSLRNVNERCCGSTFAGVLPARKHVEAVLIQHDTCRHLRTSTRLCKIAIRSSRSPGSRMLTSPACPSSQVRHRITHQPLQHHGFRIYNHLLLESSESTALRCTRGHWVSKWLVATSGLCDQQCVQA